jgi:hypothetical protein
VKSPAMKIDADEKEQLESVERGEWKSAGGGKRERTRYSRYAKATFRKDRRLNIRLSSERTLSTTNCWRAAPTSTCLPSRSPSARARSATTKRRWPSVLPLWKVGMCCWGLCIRGCPTSSGFTPILASPT